MKRDTKSISSCVIFLTFLSILIPVVNSIGPSSGEVWSVQTGDTYPISITTNIETAGNGTKNLRQTGTLQVLTTSGTGVDYTGCTGCSGQCLVLNRSVLAVEWDTVWFAVYDDYNASDETNFEITCLCPSSNAIPAKVLTTTNWQDMQHLLTEKNDTLGSEAAATGASDYVGTITVSDPTIELSYSYSNGTSDTGVKCNGIITYTNGILAKLVFNEEWKGDPSGLPPNTVVIRSEKWTMGEQGVAIPGMPLEPFLITGLCGMTLLIWKKSRRGLFFYISDSA